MPTHAVGPGLTARAKYSARKIDIVPGGAGPALGCFGQCQNFLSEVASPGSGRKRSCGALCASCSTSLRSRTNSALLWFESITVSQAEAYCQSCCSTHVRVEGRHSTSQVVLKPAPGTPDARPGEHGVHVEPQLTAHSRVLVVPTSAISQSPYSPAAHKPKHSIVEPAS